MADVYFTRDFQPISGTYERLPVPGGWIVCNTSSGRDIFIEDPKHTWTFQENHENQENQENPVKK